MIGIYKITSPNDKMYIGQSVNINKRFSRYRNLSCKKQSKIYNSLNKYGVENHIFEIIEECDVKDLNDRERYWQDYYDVLNKGLNLVLTQSSDRSGEFSKEHREKLSLLKKGSNHPHYGKFGKYHYLFGRKLSEEHKKKISDSNGCPNKKQVICKITNKIWESVKSCAEENNIRPQHLSRMLTGTRKNWTSFTFYRS